MADARRNHGILPAPLSESQAKHVSFGDKSMCQEVAQAFAILPNRHIPTPASNN